MLEYRPARGLAVASALAAMLTVMCGDEAASSSSVARSSGRDAAGAPAQAVRRLTYTMRDFERVEGACGTDGSEPCVRVTFAWPEVGDDGTPVAAAINADTLDWLHRRVFEDDGGDPESIARDLAASHAELRHEFPGVAYGWWVERRVTVARDDDRVFALQLDADMYTGGAHGIHERLYRNYRPDTGAPIALADIVIDGGMAELTAVAEVLFRQQEGIDPATAINEADFWFEGDAFALNDDFLIGTDGLHFYYNEYEIRAYAFGPTELVVPYEAIAHLLRPGARIH